VDLFRAIEISAAGLRAERIRVEVAAANLANMNSSSPAGVQGYRPMTAVIHASGTGFADLIHGERQSAPVVSTEVVAQSGPSVRTAYEPGHPNADANGLVSYPAIDHTREMLTVVTALRSYEANLAALQITKTLAAKALDIGAQ
jgi:flagellar basal-body rod protein FlgC